MDLNPVFSVFLYGKNWDPEQLRRKERYPKTEDIPGHPKDLTETFEILKTLSEILVDIIAVPRLMITVFREFPDGGLPLRHWH